MSAKDQGFTLLELIAVMAIITILAAIALPNYQRAVQRAREAVLKDNLFFMRDAIDQYYLDKEKYPESIDKLEEEKYLRAIPDDPMTGKPNWVQIREEYDPYENPDYEPGVWDVRSRSRERGTDGKRYNSY